MKKIFAITLLVGIIMSCKKEKPEERPGVYLKGDGNPDLVVTTPKNGINAFGYILQIAKMPDFNIPDGNIKLNATNGLQLSSIKNVTVTFKEKNTVLWKQVVAIAAISDIDFQPNLQRPSSTIDSVIISFDAPSASTRGTLHASLELAFMWQGQSGVFTTGRIPGRTVTFTSVNLSTSVNASTPPTGPVLSNGEREALVFDATAVGQNLIPTSVTIKVQDASHVQETRIYDGANLVATLPYTNTGTTTKTIPINGVTISSGSTKTFSVKHLLQLITTPILIESDIRTSLVSFGYKTPDGTTRSNDTLRDGKSLYVYNSLPKVSNIPITQSPVLNTQMPLYKTSIETVGGNGAMKHLTFEINMVSQGQGKILTPKLRVNGLINANVLFYNQNGQLLDSITSADAKLFASFVSGPGQELQISNTPTIVELEGTMKGYGLGDYVSIRLLGDNVQVPGSYKFLNRGSASTNNTFMKLYNDPLPNAAAQTVNFAWSDLAAGTAHSGAPFANSRDWYGGYWVYRNSNSNYQYWYF